MRIGIQSEDHLVVATHPVHASLCSWTIDARIVALDEADVADVASCCRNILEVELLIGVPQRRRRAV